MRRYYLFIISCLLVCVAYGQVSIKGVVLSEKDGLLAFANVALYDRNDSTHLIAGSITDMNGSFALDRIKIGKYHLVISFLGYETYKEIINVRMPSVSNVMNRKYTLKESTDFLDEVVVKGTRKNEYVDKSVYTFTKEQIKNARYSSDLVANIKDLTIDPLSNKINSIDGSKVKILINGISANDNDLKMIQPDKVVKIEYYDIAPAKYASVGTLVNVITKQLDTSVSGGFDASHAVQTGFANDNIYLSYIYGNHKVSFDYELNYRNYIDRQVTGFYLYQLNGQNMTNTYHDKGHFGYADHFINLKYAYILQDNWAFQMTFSPNFTNKWNYEKSQIGSVCGLEQTTMSGKTEEKIHSFGPAIDLYLSKSLDNNQELAVNLVGTYYNLNQNRTKIETDKTERILDDQLSIDNDKKSIIGEVSYLKRSGLNTLSAGYRMTWDYSNSNSRNYFTETDLSKYSSKNQAHYLYAEYAGVLGKMQYRLGAGATYIGLKNDDNSYSKVLFNPQALLLYKLSSSQNIRFSFSSNTKIPSISQLSNNIEFITTNILKRGNPYVESGVEYNAALRYSYNNAYWDFNIAAISIYDVSPIIMNDAKEEIGSNTYIIRSPENAKALWQYGGICSTSCKPFKSDLLTITLYGLYLNQYIKKNDMDYSHAYTPLKYTISSRYKNWGLNYYGSFVSAQIRGVNLQNDENSSSLMMFYQKNKFRFTVGCHWLLTKSKYSSRTWSDSVLSHSEQSFINDNSSMLVVGISWNINRGKSKNIQKKMENKDRDNGEF